MPSVLKRIIAGFLLLLAFVFAGAIILELLARRAAEQEITPPGELVDVGGYRLHALRKGQGAPTVIFEAGLDSYGHLSWFKVQDELARLTTTLSYDRAGILFSDQSDKEKSGRSMATDLSSLLNAGNYPKPFILVGHSAAGITMRRFIEDNKNDIAGVVLVDASNPAQVEYFPPKMPSRLLFRLMNDTGLIRRASAGRLYPNTYPDDSINLIGPAMMHRSYSGQYAEAASLVEMGREASALDSFGDIPTTVISATAMLQDFDSMTTEGREVATLRRDFQTELLELSSNSKQVLASKSNHYVQLEEPELVIQAIEELIQDSGRR